MPSCSRRAFAGICRRANRRSGRTTGFLGHLNGDYVYDRQPTKFAAIETRWHEEQPASEVIFVIPDEAAEKNRLEDPYLGSLIASARTIASLWHYVFPQLSCEKVGKHPYTRVVATMGVAKDPKLRAMFRRHIKRPDQRYVALAQIAGKTREAEAFANRG
jgi:hypothetical protein